MSRKNYGTSMGANIVVVDDEPDLSELLSRWLTAEGYSCDIANSGEEAVRLLEQKEYHLVISDIMLPGMSGIDLLTIVRTLFRDTAVIMITAVEGRETSVLALDLGAYGYVTKPIVKNEILMSTANALERRRLKSLRQEYERSLETKVEERTRQTRQREEEILLRLVSEVGQGHDETRSHMMRIGLYSAAIAKALGWSPEAVNDIQLAATIHDVGKIGIPDTILLKPGRLTHEEFELMKRHTTMGAEILDGSDVPLIRMAHEIALSHHEKWDGSGYPQGLAKDAIPESARIAGVVDAYDAMTNDRVYRSAFPEDEVLSMMRVGNGEYFDPRILACFLASLPEIGRIKEEVRDDEPKN